MQSPDPRNTNRREGCDIRASLRDKAKPIAIKGDRSKCGGCGRKAPILTQGGLSACLLKRRGVPQGILQGRQKSAEAIRRMANPSEGPNMKTKGETLRFVVMAAQKIHENQPETSKGEAFGNSRRCVK
jgi:hypothetical protein